MPISHEVLQRLKAKGTANKSTAELAHRMTAKPDPSCFEGLPVTGDLQADSYAEMDALLAAMEAADAAPLRQYAEITDSPHYVAVCFLSRADKEYLLIAMGLFGLGDKYLLGSEFATAVAHIAANGPYEVKRATKEDPVIRWKRENPELTDQQIAFRLASEKTKNQMNIQGDGEFWFALCFATADERDAFLTRYPPIEGWQYLDGYLLGDAVGVHIPEE